jgi:hypothetical protein
VKTFMESNFFARTKQMAGSPRTSRVPSAFGTLGGRSDKETSLSSKASRFPGSSGSGSSSSSSSEPNFDLNLSSLLAKFPSSKVPKVPSQSVFGSMSLGTDLDDYHESDPDSIYRPGSITFMYDQHDDVLYHAKYPTTHYEIMRGTYEDGVTHPSRDNADYPDDSDYSENKQGSYQIAKKLGITAGDRMLGIDRDDGLAKGYLLGRLAMKDRGTVIGFWHNEDHRLKENDLINCLKAMKRELGNWVDENTIVFSEMSKSFPPFYVKDQIDIDQSSEEREEDDDNGGGEDEPKCDTIAKINVDSKQMDFTQILSAMHMVKGNQMDRIKAAYCSAAPQIKQQLQQQGCNNYLSLADNIWSRMKCKAGDDQAWNQLKQAGRRAYRDNLRDTFRKGAESSKRGEDYLGTQFRTQKELDAAWDDLMHGKREHTLNFKEWLTKEDNHEAQRRNSGIPGATSNKRDGRRLRSF